MANTKSLSLVQSSSQHGYITNANQTGLNITGDISIEFWMNLSSYTGAQRMVWKGFAGDYGYTCSMESSKVLYFGYYADDPGNTYFFRHITTAFTDEELDTWIHIAITADVSEKDVKFYKNGSLVSSTSDGGTATSINDSAGPFSIGSAYGAADPKDFFDGLLDEVIVWNDVRTSTEISESYNSGDGKIYDGDEAGMVGYWRFEDNADDSQTSGNNDLTLANSPSYSTDVPFSPSSSGNNTHSVDLELSSSQYAYCLDNAALSITGDITIEAWVKIEQLPSTAGTDFIVVSKYNVTVDYAYNFAINAVDKLYFLYSSNNSPFTYTASATDSAVFDGDDVGEWVHIACAVDVSSQSFAFYKNGSLVADTPIVTNSSAIQDGTSRFAIGIDYGSGLTPRNFFDGLIDEVRVWNDVRSESEIQDNDDSELDGDEDGLAGYWKLNNDYTDETSNGNDLTAVNTPTFSTDVPFSGSVSTAVQDIIGMGIIPFAR